MKIVIVGHVDHGKSTLIGRLLFDTNSLPEEKITEIKETCKMLGRKLEFAYILDALEEERIEKKTIETTQICFRTKKRIYTIIDSPGHKEFLKNMVTGASYADIAILIIDVKEGVKEQTKKHAYILKILGVDKIIVVINKMDLVNYKSSYFENIKTEIKKYLKSIGLKCDIYIPISAYNGDNIIKKSEKMRWYKGLTLIEEMDKINIDRRDYDFRFCVQDFYNGVILGNILSGSIKVGEKIFIYPEKKKTRIKKILYGNEMLKKAQSPLSVGIVLEENINVKRGFVLCKGKKPKIINKIKTFVMCLLDCLKEGENYELLCYTQEVKCKIRRIIEKINVETLKKEYANILKDGEIGNVIIELNNPVVMDNFNNLPEIGRFAISKNGKLIGGGRL